MFTISTFYKFQELPHYQSLKQLLLDFCIQQDLKGSILLANEGINATIAGTREAIDAFYHELTTNHGITLHNAKESFLNYKPFGKMKVRLKKEIVKLGLPHVNGQDAGTYIKPAEWDDFISRDDVVVIDTRNNYEIALGTFKDAIDPQTRFFNEFPSWFEANKEQFQSKKIAMCCTGGIRCEKSTAYLKSLGLTDVFHLEGGILNYLEKMGHNGQTWQGDCYVFDERVAVDADLDQSTTIDPHFKKTEALLKQS
ncbi:MAG: hypothetical protein J0G29_04445 [Alphaproteobacteria bacterium]|nr:hypothetical protein [Alphaproteobacteria bacterium]OJV47936.1 MAG: hypothetical protein BGO28_03660 [Alphaproteobacteria bacterium 43-37]